jgi:hypothetical protein
VLLKLVIALAIPLNARVAAADATGAVAVADEIVRLIELAVFDGGAVHAESIYKLLQAYDAKVLVHRKFMQTKEVLYCLIRKVESMARLVGERGQSQLLGELEETSARIVQGCLMFGDRPRAAQLAAFVSSRLASAEDAATRSAAERLSAKFRQLGVL